MSDAGRSFFVSPIPEAEAFIAGQPPADCVPIHRLFEAQATRTPHAIAVSWGAQDLTYAELDRQATRIACAIRNYPMPAEPLIGVCIDRSLDMIACLLGVLKAGAAYLPLDPELPPARLEQIVEDAAPAIVVGHPGRAFRTAPVVTLNALLAQAASAPLLFRNDASPDALAYVIYTSGSTGRPKGVEITHRSVANLLQSAMRTPGFRPGDTVLSVTRMTFDVSVLDFFLPLTCGARLVLLPLATSADPHPLAQAIAKARPTVMQATPAIWRSLCEIGWIGSPDLRIWSGGEAMTPDLARRLLPLCGELWNLYGPTETTVWSTMHRIRQVGSAVPIGEPIDRTSLCIVDDDLREVPFGWMGELCIGGAGLARGYRDRPDLTASRFVTLQSGERVYRTGDLARYEPDGKLLCLGRADDQVKIRGHRVEMGELEAVLMLHPGIEWAAVRCWPDAIGENALFAYIVPAGPDCDLRSVQAHVRALLPAYMVPHAIQTMMALPLTPNGKVDRNALPMPTVAAPIAEAQADLTETERRLATIWRELLSVGPIGADDDFFDLGGYSLLTVRLVRRVAETFAITLSLGDLLAASSLSAMAARLDRGGGEAGCAIFPLQPLGSRLPLFWLDGGPLLRSMARAIGPEQPVLAVGITPREEADLLAKGFDIPQLAAAMVMHIRTHQPHGPYHLGGWCRWGIVAFEAARQLCAAGERVASLILLDADNPARRPCSREIVVQLARRMQRLIRPDEAPAETSFSQAVEDAGKRYRPRRYDGNVVLLQPHARPAGSSEDGGWRPVVGGALALYRTAGDHISMVRAPYAGELGATIGRALTSLSH